MQAVFYPSPTNDIWFPAKEFPIAKTRPARLRKMNAKANEFSVIDAGASIKPSVLELAAEIETSKSTDKVLDKLAEWIAENLSESYINLDVFGCCDVGGSDFCVGLERYVPMLSHIRVMDKVEAREYSELGNKFEDLHPIMFGSRKVCVGLSALLGDDAKIITGRKSPGFGVIRLAHNIDNKSAKEKASRQLLPTIR